MRQNKILQGVLVAGGLSLAVSGTAYAGSPSGEMLGNTCAGCHGTHGNSQGPATPTITGISKEFFIDAMEAYKNDQGNPTIMNRIAKGYSAEEIAAMAEYFTNRKFEAHKQEFDVKTAKRGYILHDKFCEKCHENGGRSKDDDAGILAGQWSPYVRWSIQDYIAGKREAPKKMKGKLEDAVEKVGEADAIEQLVNYYASQVD